MTWRWPFALRSALDAALAEAARLRAENRELLEKVTAICDNALFAAGMQPIFDPRAERFAPRKPSEEHAVVPVRESPAALRHRLEAEARARAQERDRRRLTEKINELMAEAQEADNGKTA